MTGGDGIFMIRDGKLVVLLNSPYETEDVLQEALATFPEVLAGRDDHRRTAIGPPAAHQPGEGDSHDRGRAPRHFSLDHLFVDHAGVPVVVEVEEVDRHADQARGRRTNARLRSERGEVLARRPNCASDFEKSCELLVHEP